MRHKVQEEGFKALGSMRPSLLSGTWALSLLVPLQAGSKESFWFTPLARARPTVLVYERWSAMASNCKRVKQRWLVLEMGGERLEKNNLASLLQCFTNSATVLSSCSSRAGISNMVFYDFISSGSKTYS